MSNWYYADAAQQRQGPLPAEEIVRLFHQGRLRLDTLVWHDGLADWQPLRDFAQELALHQVPAETFYTPMQAGPAETQPAAADPFAAPADAAPDSPYAPPRATLVSANAAVQGGEVVHAGLWKRVAASFIDSFVTAMLSYVLLIPLMLVFGIGLGSLAQSDFASAGFSVSFLILQYAISIGVPALYFGWMQSSSSMASLGKMAVGVKVVRGNGDRLSFWRSFLRYIALVLFTVVTCGLGVLIAGLMVAFTERKQGVHDMICDTLVVDKWAFTAHPEWQKRELGTVTIVILGIFGVLFLGMIALLAVIFGLAASSGSWH